jgi:hypothetical protein
MTLTLVRNGRRKIPLTSRPDGSVLNPDHPLVRNGSLAWANFGSGFGSFTMRDQSGKGNNGTLTGYTNPTSWNKVLGRSALAFVGANNQRILTANGPMSGSSGTWAAWVMQPASTSYQVFASDGNFTSEVNGVNFYINGLVPQIETCSASAHTATTSASVMTVNVFSHVAATWNASALIIYYNGVATSTKTSPNLPTHGTSYNFTLGNDGAQGGSYKFTGSIADPLCCNAVLPASTIARLANPGNVMFDTGGCSLLLPPRRVVFPSAGTGGGTVYTLTAGTGSYTSSGTAAAIIAIRNLPAGTGSYTSSGTAAAAKVVRNLTAGTGSYSSSGTGAAAKAVRKLSAGTGTYTYTGTPAVMFKGKGIAAGSGVYASSGTAASIIVLRKPTFGTGSYSYSGTAATLTKYAAGTLIFPIVPYWEYLGA